MEMHCVRMRVTEAAPTSHLLLDQPGEPPLTPGVHLHLLNRRGDTASQLRGAAPSDSLHPPLHQVVMDTVADMTGRKGYFIHIWLFQKGIKTSY